MRAAFFRRKFQSWCSHQRGDLTHSVPVWWVFVGHLHWNVLWIGNKRMMCLALVVVLLICAMDIIESLISKSHSRPPNFQLREDTWMPLQQREGRTEQGRWSEEKWERDKWVKFHIRGCQQRFSPCPHLTCTCCSLNFIVLAVSWEIEVLLRVVAWDLILGRTRYMCCSLFMEKYI